MIDEEIQIFGFGSFFKGSKSYNDIDLLLLHKDLSPYSRQFSITCKRILSGSPLNLHITMLSTPEEKSMRFLERSSATKIHAIHSKNIIQDIDCLLKIIEDKIGAK